MNAPGPENEPSKPNTGNAGQSPAATTQDALSLLRADHAKLDALFADDARLAGTAGREADRSALLARIGALLTAHAKIEEEIFYPALEEGDDAELIRNAQAEHQDVLDRLEKVAGRSPDGHGFDQEMASLADAVRRHAAWEEESLFPLARRLDLDELGTRLALRRGTLMPEPGAD